MRDSLPRRRLLSSLGIAGVTALAGCSSLTGSTNSETQTDTQEQTPEQTDTPEETTEQAPETTPTPDPESPTQTDTPTPTETQTPVEDLSGDQVYENNLYSDNTQFNTDSGRTTAREFAESLENDQEFVTDAQSGNDLDYLDAIAEHALTQVPVDDDPHANQDGYQILEYLIHNNVGLNERKFQNKDNARIFQDVSRPRQGGALTCTVILDNELYAVTPNADNTPGKTAKLENTNIWDPRRTASHNALDYFEIENEVEDDYGGDWEAVPQGQFEGLFNDLSKSYSFDNSGDWLAPSESLHKMGAAVHHFAMGHDYIDDEEFNFSAGDIEAEDVIKFRDGINKERHNYIQEINEGKTLKMDVEYEPESGEFEFMAEDVDDYDFSDGYAEF